MAIPSPVAIFGFVVVAYTAPTPPVARIVTFERKVSIFFCVGVKDVCAVAFYVRGSARNFYAQMVLGYDFHGEMILEHTNVRLAFYGFYESALYFKARVVGVVQNAKFECPPSRCRSYVPSLFFCRSELRFPREI